VSRTAAALVRPRPSEIMIEWPPGSTPCRTMPAAFESVTTDLDRRQAAHLCRVHCPKFVTCTADRATAPVETLTVFVWAGRLDYSSGGAVRIDALPSRLCPAKGADRCAPE